jgi:hypothetical protein
MIDTLRTEITTNSSGAASKTTGSLNGKLLGVAVKLGTAAAIDLVVADADGLNLLTKTTINASARINARGALALNTDGSALSFYDAQPVVGPLTFTIANGGDTKTASIILYLES